MKIRVVSYNIHKCIGGVDRVYNPARTIACLAHYAPDVVLLQEVDAGVKRSMGDHQASLLADGLGLAHHAWFPNVRVRGGGTYGNAVLSRFPLAEIRNIDLTVAPKKRRSALHAACRIGNGVRDQLLHVFNLHLGLAQYERRIQIENFVESHPLQGLSRDEPVVIGGDLNDVWGTLAGWLAPHGFTGVERRPRTFPAWAPMRALDGVYVRGALLMHAVERGETELARRASDHRPLIADLELT
jgi:endonuclease/exonuclease/phosphatase family metal-dependent hydrolase